MSRLATFNHKQRNQMIWARLSMYGANVESLYWVVALPSSSSNACSKSKFIFDQTHLLEAYRKRPSGRTKNPSPTQHFTPRKYTKKIWSWSYNKSQQTARTRICHNQNKRKRTDLNACKLRNPNIHTSHSPTRPLYSECVYCVPYIPAKS